MKSRIGQKSLKVWEPERSSWGGKDWMCRNGRQVGQWSAPLSFRVRRGRELEEAAGNERRRLGNLSALSLEWACEPFNVAGRIDRLSSVDLTTPQPWQKRW